MDDNEIKIKGILSVENILEYENNIYRNIITHTLHNLIYKDIINYNTEISFLINNTIILLGKTEKTDNSEEILRKMLKCVNFNEVTQDMKDEYANFFKEDENYNENINEFFKNSLKNDFSKINTIVLIIKYNNNQNNIEVPLYPDYKQYYIPTKAGKRTKKSKKTAKKAKKAKKSAKKTKRHR